MTEHVVDIQTQFVAQPGFLTRFRYRWACSCGDAAKRWCIGSPKSGAHATAARRARAGGDRHVAARGMSGEHVTSIEDRIVTAVDNNGATYETAEWRWRCSCGRGCKWKWSEANSRGGAVHHLAAMARSGR